MNVKTTTKLVLVTLLTLAGAPAFAQVGLAVGALTPDPSAALDVSSSKLGVLLPRVGLLSTTDNSTIATPATGLLVYNTSASINNLPGLVYNSGTSAAPVWSRFDTQGTNWGLRGNSNTSPATNFLGTTDNQPLVFRANNNEVARLTTSGALWLQKTDNNVFVGYQAGFNNQPGANDPTDGTENMFVGTEAGYSNIYGFRNQFIGNQAGYANTEGINNQFIGTSAGRNSLGDQNQFIGLNSGYNNTSGGANIFIGLNSGFNNLTGQGNQFIGLLAGYGNTTGNSNLALGNQASLQNKTGSRNVAIGPQAGSANTGDNNTFLGSATGLFVTSGSNNLFIGYQAGIVSYTQHSNASAIGYLAKVDQDNAMVLGGTGQYAVNVGIGTEKPSEVLHVVGNILASGTITQNSDARLKTNVHTLAGALASVERLRGVRYEFLPGKGPVGPQVGVLAQELEKVYPELVRTDALTGIKSVNYAQLTPILIEAIKELEAESVAAKERFSASLESLSKRIEALEAGTPLTPAATVASH